MKNIVLSLIVLLYLAHCKSVLDKQSCVMKMPNPCLAVHDSISCHQEIMNFEQCLSLKRCISQTDQFVRSCVSMCEPDYESIELESWKKNYIECLSSNKLFMYLIAVYLFVLL